ncbi:MAG: restriction endonuclease subunit S [Cytophagales bacterium]|nr:restriction endonuclease subunit S [Cytophagales bacterium]MCA6373384.1 restriction endonuclease subunit S [Cytophagales bacterium]MCA6377046.1 restriction endonuclease subunit S [Cytophagales bacterium]MCA6382515.1 restriction endonuclease subunit S [Cytophagales bacterium]
MYFRPNTKRLNSQFLYFYLSSEPIKKYLNDNAGGTTMANLNLKIVNEIPISLPHIEEQGLIVQEIESRLSVCDKIEETITTSLAQAETLRQSILKKAFEGKLL